MPTNIPIYTETSAQNPPSTQSRPRQADNIWHEADRITGRSNFRRPSELNDRFRRKRYRVTAKAIMSLLGSLEDELGGFFNFQANDYPELVP